MAETIIAALISAGAAIAVCVISNKAQFNRMLAEIEKQNAVQSTEIKQLTKTVEKHNQVIERVFILERQDEVEKEQIKVINHRIADLENYHKN